MQENKVTTLVKGIIIGATMIVPGVSGGTMAMILGIYDQLISSISSFRKAVKENLIFLSLFVLGAGAGAFFFSSHLSWLLTKYPLPTMYFFMGAVLGGVPLIQRQANVEKVSWEVILYIFAGVCLVLLISGIPVGFLQGEMMEGKGSILILMIMGTVSAIALILPGISISHFFLIMGMYDDLILAIKEFNLGFLVPVGIGGIIGIFLFSKVLEMLMRQYPKQTYMIILGFILGSVAEIFPGVPMDWSLVWCVGMAVVGFLLMKKIGG